MLICGERRLRIRRRLDEISRCHRHFHAVRALERASTQGGLSWVAMAVAFVHTNQLQLDQAAKLSSRSGARP